VGLVVGYYPGVVGWYGCHLEALGDVSGCGTRWMDEMRTTSSMLGNDRNHNNCARLLSSQITAVQIPGKMNEWTC
jgi:hypothetical protein